MGFDLNGRTALITGASSGLGAHFAEIFVAAGARVVIGARRVDRVEALAARLGDKALPVAIDVTDEGSIAAAYNAAEAKFGPIDTVIANAGVANGGRTVDVEPDKLRQTIDTNFTGVLLTAREGARRMIAAGSRDSGRGRVVLVGSITAHVTGHGDSAYAASKAAVAHLGRNLAREWVRMGINVNVIQPGYIQTEIAGDWFQSEGGAKQVAGWHRRRFMPIDVLDPQLLYFASDASAMVTGSVIDIDDGQSL
ncbi:SDR family NAD(P)-dependent oxidoreductase [Sphingomonas jeddahensis]|uniref:3-oxoacyl-[acyl-carrier-protein] reductase FabG n=1 Tax=Sphingomonas jeddahensis TaxID=1915074 RepID=A0A1V2EV57_9SPHN|nr:SDR family NAD(P)-dependent oxidoreductase [Sphingomonas jeddahensis]ONF96355.1 3-oxoacyl-[acyl-carrier-protein] reductase FabG [Sphingomonas jeddahensis]